MYTGIFFGCFFLTLALIGILRPLSPLVGLVDKPGGRKRHAVPTPLIGGISMFLAVSAGLAITRMAPMPLLAFIVGSGLLVLVGTLDDREEIDYRYRLLAQLCAAGIMVFWGDLKIAGLGNLFGAGPISLGPLSIPFTLFAIIGLINAVNMLDGLDGLAGGVVLAILLPVTALSVMLGNEPTMALCLVLIATILGFLIFNYRFPWRHTAPVFMGDAGSNFLGYALAWVLLTLAHDEPHAISPISILWIVAIPVVDTLSIMWRRYRKGQSTFSPDRDHVHHMLMRAGFGVNATVLITSSITITIATAGISAALVGIPEPVLTLGFVLLLFVHYHLVRHAWKFTKRIRHLLAAGHTEAD